jgi:hypothetical protein
LRSRCTTAGHSSLRLFVAETNSAEKISAEQDVMDPRLRHRVLRGVGFLPLELSYTQPALQITKSKCDNLLLCVHQFYLQGGGAPAAPIADWLREFFKVLMGRRRGRRDPDYLRMMRVLSALSCVPLAVQEGGSKEAQTGVKQS